MDEAIALIKEMLDAFQTETKNYPTWQEKRAAIIRSEQVKEKARNYIKQHENENT